MYADTAQIAHDLTDILTPPPRQPVHQTATENIRLRIPGAYDGPFRTDKCHYLNEPAECLTLREYMAVIFAGPAQCGKTQCLIDNYIAHTVLVDPIDMLVVQTTQGKAADFSLRRVSRMHDNNPCMKDRLYSHASADNLHLKQYKSGILLTLGWPTKNHLSGNAFGRVVLTDFDRMDDDIGGEGSAFVLAENRLKTFLSRGMICAESSPSREVTDLTWKLTEEKPHEAPPCGGILGLYNSGDRRRAYCQCQHCGDYWTPAFDMEAGHLPEGESLDERIQEFGLVCPHCASINLMVEHEQAIKQSVVWLREHQKIDNTGTITGEGRKSNRASFWLPGWFAGYETWAGLVRKHEMHMEGYLLSGDEEGLKGHYNAGFGTVYVPMARRTERTSDAIMERAKPELVKGEIPAGARTLIGTVDVQKSRFVVQFESFGEGKESTIIDRFDIELSTERFDEDGNLAAIQPPSYAEDWHTLVDKVINRGYLLSDGSGRMMRAHRILCDSHGAPGSTDKAYKFWRWCKKNGYGNRFRLLRGGNSVKAPLQREIVPDKKDGKGKKKPGDIPVIELNVNKLKDEVFAVIDRTSPGAGDINFPGWLESKWFDELLAEERNDKGIWEKKNPNADNETIDHLGYARGALHFIGFDRIDWDKPPRWAGDWNINSNVYSDDKPKPRRKKKRVSSDYIGAVTGGTGGLF